MRFKQVLSDRFGGVLLLGSHNPDGAGCALEVASVARGISWTDAPDRVGLPDIRAINDCSWPSDRQRALHIAPVIEALWDWPDWSHEDYGTWTQEVARRSITELLPIGLRELGLHDHAERVGRSGHDALEDAAEAVDGLFSDAGHRSMADACHEFADAKWFADQVNGRADATRFAEKVGNATLLLTQSLDDSFIQTHPAESSSHTPKVFEVLKGACVIWKESVPSKLVIAR